MVFFQEGHGMEIHIIGNKLIVTITLLFIGITNIFAFGKGIFYPRLFFTFDNIDNNFYWGAADKACELATEKTPEVNVLFRQPGNSFKAEFYPVFLTKKNYSNIFLKIYQFFVQNHYYAKFILSTNVRGIGEHKKGWITNGIYYCMNGWDAEPEDWKDKSKLWPETNFEKIFKGKKNGDEFFFDVRITYRFDNEEEKTLLVPFKVKTFKGRYISPFAGL